MAGFVVCASCGTRIRADRRWCLKCGEELVAAVDRSDPAVQRNQRAAAVAVITVFGALGVTLFLIGRPAPVDEAAVPAAGATASPVIRTTALPKETARASEFVPATPTEHVRLGAVSYASGDFEAAHVRFEQAVAKNPDDPEALNSLGLVLARLQRTDEAIERFTRAVQLAPDKWAYHFNLAHALGEKGRFEEAIAEYRTAARLFPEDYATQYNLAIALHKKGDDAAAVPEFERAITLAPGEPSFHLSFGITLEKLGRTADARQEYVKYVAMNPDAPDAAKVKAHVEQLAAAPAGPKPQAP